MSGNDQSQPSLQVPSNLPKCNFPNNKLAIFMERAIRPEGTPEHAMPLSFPSMNLQTPKSCDPVAISQQELAIAQHIPSRNLQTRRNLLSHRRFPAGTCKLAGTCYHTAHSQQWQSAQWQRAQWQRAQWQRVQWQRAQSHNVSGLVMLADWKWN